MDLPNRQKELSEISNLRLVEAGADIGDFPEIERQFIGFTFFRVNAEWKRLDPETKAACINEFCSLMEDHDENFLLFWYLLTGFDARADLMLWRIGTSMDLLQEMTVRMFQTSLGKYLEICENYLSVTRKMMFIADDGLGEPRSRLHVIAGMGKYHFLYPCAKSAEWYERTPEERDAMIQDNFMVGQKFPNIRVHLTHAFGAGDHEYLVSFETDEPKDFLLLMEELRETPACKMSLRGIPVYTCRQRSLRECLEMMG